MQDRKSRCTVQFMGEDWELRWTEEVDWNNVLWLFRLSIDLLLKGHVDPGIRAQILAVRQFFHEYPSDALLVQMTGEQVNSLHRMTAENSEGSQ